MAASIPLSRKYFVAGVVTVISLCLVQCALAAQDIDSLLSKADSQRKAANYSSARKTIEKAMRMLQSPGTGQLSRLSAAHNYFALIENGAGHYGESEQHARKAIEFAKQAGLGEDTIAMHSVVLANALRQQKKYLEAEKILQTALPILDKPSTNQALLGTAQNNLGAIYFWLGDYQMAIPWLKKGLATRLAALGPKHADVANSYLDLGATEFKMGEVDAAFEHISDSVKIRRAALGSRHPETLASEAALAVVLHAKGNTEEANLLLRNVVTSARKALGPGHPDLAHYQNEYADTLDELASRSVAANDLAAAHVAFAKSAQLRATNGPTVAHAVTLANLSDVLARMGRKDESIKVLRQATRVVDELPEPLKANPDCASILDRLKNLEKSAR